MYPRFGHVSAAVVLTLAFSCSAFAAMAANKPVPLINQPLVPDAVVPGGPGFTLTVNGTGFVADSVVKWNGRAQTTVFVSGSQLTAQITAADIANPGTASITIADPAPGGVVSNGALLSITTTSSTVGFRLASSLATGISPSAVAIGDFNGDGKQDLAIANLSSNTVSILLGDGAGNFTLVSSNETGNNPDSIAVGDFNNDGKLDLAVANNLGGDSGSISILLGDGTGKFTRGPTYGISGETFSIAAGDFNGDGKLDLAIANYSGDTVLIFLGDGRGNFIQTPVSPATGAFPSSVAVGDFNADGKLDLAVTNYGSNTVSILLGDGTGKFTLALSPATGTFPISIAVGDLNGDGKLDLAVVNFTYEGTVCVLLGDGTGNFTLASSPKTGGGPRSIAIGDFNGDNKLDLAVVNAGGDGGARPIRRGHGQLDLAGGGERNIVSILLGDGTGNFTLASSPATGLAPVSAAVGDFNGDGKVDLAVANQNSDTASILLQGPAVTLSPPSLTFSIRKVGTTSPPQMVTVTNVGYAAVDISGIPVTGRDAADFSQTNTCPSSLPIGEKCMIAVTFSPVNGGARTAAVSTSGTGGSSPSSVSLTGEGVSVILSPEDQNFGNVMVGQKSQPMVSTLTNIAATALGISSIRIGQGDAKDFSVSNTCGKMVPPGGMCTITATFTPTKAGPRSATVDIYDNSGGPQHVKLSGTGT